MKVLLLFLAVGGMAALACGDAEEPDRVVGVVLRCDRIWRGETTERQGSTCNDRSDGSYAYQNRRLELTIREGGGGTYQVEVVAEADFAVGDIWPPD